MKSFFKKILTSEEPVPPKEGTEPEAPAAPPVRTAERESGTPLTHSTAAKVTAFILAILMTALLLGSVLVAALAIDQELYTIPEGAFRRDIYSNLAQSDAGELFSYLRAGQDDEAMWYLDYRNIASVEAELSVGGIRNWSYDGGRTASSYSFTFDCYIHADGHEAVYERNEYPYAEFAEDGSGWVKTGEISVSLANSLTEKDIYHFTDTLITAAYALRYWAYVIGLAALIMAIVCYVFLLCASGHRAGAEDVIPGWGTKLPFDLLTAAALFCGYWLIYLLVEASYFHSYFKLLAAYGAAGTCLLIIFLGWSMSLALRVKLGGWWKNTLIYHALRLLWLFLKTLGRGFMSLIRGAGRLTRSVPLVWKTVLGFACLTFIELFVILLCWWEFDNLVIWWVIGKLIMFPAVLILALILRRLQRGGEALAQGRLGYQVDTRRMFWDFKRHGENLNSIGEGMAAAVEQRLKSERMKTELITNVSHDIKTPLTSIINYADLIEKEPCDNPKITEYAGVLHRQSDRLKRLIDDLVEASKASTGNLEVLLAPCEVGVMLTQTAGEYEQRLKERKLELVTRQPERPVKILADGRRLWRVFDNLMNNVCKYAQSGTRVYLTLEEREGRALISFKNTSREPLDLSAEEFMERFVQGDASRSSDGNGLGLSIARSLTDLQKGRLDLTVDGDLFKVVLSFPTL